MRRRMLFKIGVSLIIVIGIVLFFLVDVDVSKDNYVQQSNNNAEGVDKKKIVVASEHYDNDKLFYEGMKNRVVESEGEAVINQRINEQIDSEQAALENHLKKIESLHEKEEDSFDDKNVLAQEKSMNQQEIENESQQLSKVYRSHDGSSQPILHLSVVVCESRAQEALVMLKSAAMVTRDAGLFFHIVADKARQKILHDVLESWPLELKARVSYQIYNVTVPEGRAALSSWNKLYKPCAAQRLFLPDRLPWVDSAIYVDTDVLFLHSVKGLWSHFGHFNSSQLVGMVSEAEDRSAGWYNRFASHPYYGSFGLNSGVMLMNLTRLRQAKWMPALQDAYEKYRLSIVWGDQDLLNVYFSTRPGQMYLVPCEWNYRADHCMYTSNCKSAEKNGVSLLHGSRGAFYSGKEPVLGAVHQAFENISFKQNALAQLLEDMKNRLRSSASSSNCGQVARLFLTHLSSLIASSDSLPHYKSQPDTNGDLDNLERHSRNIHIRES